MLKYVSKLAMDILPSLAATIIGAYIVNHYIVARPAADAPAAAVSSARPGPQTANLKTSETSGDTGNLPEAGVRAKGISEKAILERSAAEKRQEKAQEKAQEKPATEKIADRPTETASIPADTPRRQALPREKALARTAPVQAAAPTVAAPNAAPAAEAVAAPEEHPDANELARAAIERLRGGDGSARPQEATRAPDPVHVPEAARTPEAPHVVSAPAIRPLPPPIMVSTPSTETWGAPASSQTRPPYPTSARIDDPLRPTPPADIPAQRPLDLQADAGEPVARQHTNVAQDMLAAAKSMFHAVLPK